jgi:hypothetical protein
MDSESEKAYQNTKLIPPYKRFLEIAPRKTLLHKYFGYVQCLENQQKNVNDNNNRLRPG